jgi:hypothetical protein
MKKLIAVLRIRDFVTAALLLGAAAAFGCSTQKTEATNADTKAVKAAETNQTTEVSKNVPRPTDDDLREMDYWHEMYYDRHEDARGDKDESKAVSKADFEKIKNGMTYNEVVKALGDEGMRVSTMKVNGRETEIYKWSNRDFSKYIDVTFEKEKVVEKSQKGLK